MYIATAHVWINSTSIAAECSSYPTEATHRDSVQIRTGHEKKERSVQVFKRKNKNTLKCPNETSDVCYSSVKPNKNNIRDCHQRKGTLTSIIITFNVAKQGVLQLVLQSCPLHGKSPHNDKQKAQMNLAPITFLQQKKRKKKESVSH